MRKIITITFVTLDGVMQAPGGSKEDTAGGFKYGGWQMDHLDDMSGKIIDGFMKIPFEMLLGKRTYDIFAGYWPHTDEAPEIAEPFNAAKKYVAMHEQAELLWHNSFPVTGNVTEEIKKLKSMDAPDLWVWGSGNLIQTLLANDLIDRMHIWTYPITLGSGKKLFAEGTTAKSWKLVDSQISTTGAILSTYEPKGPLNE